MNETAATGLPWPDLIKGTLVKRYKRFMADVDLEDGGTVTTHCTNSGRMTGCCESGRTVYLSFHDNPKRKLKYTWELIHMPGSLVGVNTLVPNRLVRKSVEAGIVEELTGYEKVESEIRAGENSRIDLMLSNSEKDRCYVEIKNCTLVENRLAFFPDAVTARGLKHLNELGNLVSQGFRSVMFYVIQRTDADLFKPADHIDPAYGDGLRLAIKDGVEVLVYDVRIDLKTIALNRPIPFEI